MLRITEQSIWLSGRCVLPAKQRFLACGEAFPIPIPIPIALDGTSQLYEWLNLWITPIRELYLVVPAAQTSPKLLQKITR